MGEQNRGLSGGSTAMIVVAILGGILVIGCCGGIVLLGASGIWLRSELQEFDVVESPIKEQLRQDLDSFRIPDEPPLEQLPASALEE